MWGVAAGAGSPTGSGGGVRRADGWVRQGIGTAVLITGFFVALTFTVGPVLGWVSDRIGEWL